MHTRDELPASRDAAWDFGVVRDAEHGV